jgi:hypothetical protein
MGIKSSQLRSRLNLVGWLFGYKAVLLLLIYLSVVLLPPLFFEETYYSNIHVQSELHPVGRYFSTWDAQPYLIISESGYQADSRLAAFFPLWPFCIWLFSYLTAGHHLLSGIILANIVSVFALLALHEYVSAEKGLRFADRTLLLLLAFPGSLFLMFPYSEALFLLLTVSFFHQLTKSNYFITGILGFLAALTRPVGVLLIIPCALRLLRDRKFSALPSIALPLLGYLSYLAIMYFYTGDALRGFRAQEEFFSSASLSKIFDIVGFIKSLYGPTQVHGFIGSVIDRIWFLLFCASLPFIWKMNKEWFSYSLLMGLVPAMTLSFVSFTRYVMVIFPVFIVSAHLFSAEWRERWFYLLLASLFGMQVIFLTLHINNYWAG